MTATPTLDAEVTGLPQDDAPGQRVDVELAAAFLALLAVMAMGLWFMVRPGPTALDRWVMAVVPHVHRSGSLVASTRLGSPFVLAVGAAVGFLATAGRNFPRALALLTGPVMAVGLGDAVVKPVVGRTFAAVVSFPSGTVTAVAALAAVGVLAVPTAWRRGAAVLGTALSTVTALSVVALRWHYPTDALAALAMGAGVVLLADATARRLAAKTRGASKR
jgi:membrane-associated phospholipid phosphatase